MTMTKLIPWILLTTLANLPWSMAAAEDTPLHEWGKHSDDELYEGAITIEAQDGTRKVAKVLGGPLGKETVDGIEVGLFVLQATNPERMKPGAKGPTHIFNVTFMEEDGSQLIKEALGAVVIEKPGLEPQRVAFRPVGSHHQAFARLEEKGEYQIRVEFVTSGRKGETQARPFDYTGKFMFHSHGHDRH
jgi:hypothetical protein